MRDSLVIEGRADDLRFRDYDLEVRPAGAGPWEALAESRSPVTEGVLGGWNTTSVGDGDYELRLSVADTLGLAGTYVVKVIVDNEAPWASETTPAIVRPASGGDVYTTNREVHLYFPPGGFEEEAEVRIERLGEAQVPDTLLSGAARLHPGYEISWGEASLTKPATLELSCAGLEPASYKGGLALYGFGADSTWERVGAGANLAHWDGRDHDGEVVEDGVYLVTVDAMGQKRVKPLAVVR